MRRITRTLVMMLLLCTPLLCHAQCPAEDFTAAATPAGWLATAVSYTETPGQAAFTSNAGSLTTAVVANPVQLTFSLSRTTNPNAKTLFVEVSTTSQTSGFTTIATYDHNNTTSGGTTAVTVNLSAYTGSAAVYIRLTKSSTTTAPWRVDNMVFTCSSCTAPGTQASALSFGAVTGTGQTLNFTRGNGNNLLIVRNAGSAPDAPASGSNYNLNDPVGSAGTVVYNGSAAGPSLAASLVFSSLSPETNYFYGLQEYASTGLCYKAPALSGSAWTLSAPVTGQASGLNAVAASANQVNLSWTAATFPSSGATTKGYVLLRADGANAPVLSSNNGQAPAAGANTTLVATLAQGAVMYSNTGLSGSTTYNYLLVPFTWNGTDAATYNYLTTAAPTASATTTAAPSVLSDIIANSGFTYLQNIAYGSYQAVNIANSGNDIEAGQLIIRDGGAGTNDADNLTTTVTALTLSLSNSANIRRVALYDGTTELLELAGGSSLSFTGLNIVVADNSSKTISIRVSFNGSVTDNQNFGFAVMGATASGAGSGFAAANAGGAATATAGDDNRIEVTATQLAFVQQPGNTATGFAMTPSPSVRAIDALSNTDLDYTGTVSLTSTGTLSSSPLTQAASAGVATFGSVVHSVIGSGLFLNASATGPGTVISGSFNITAPPTAPANSYRTVTGGTWTNGATTSTWERLISGTWTSSSAPAANTTNNIYIRHAIGASSVTPSTVIVESGGYLTINSATTIGSASILAQNGGGIEIAANATINGNFILESGALLVVNNSAAVNTSAMWNGDENFKAGSTVEIRNWNYSAGAATRSLIASTSQVSLNSNGYYFGNLLITGAPSSLFTMVNGSQSANLCENNFSMQATGTNNVAFTNAASNVTIGGSVQVGTNQLSIAASTTGLPVVTINGNLEMTGGTINLNQNSSTATVTLNLKGNLLISGGTFTNTDADGSLVFSGTTTQNITVAPAAALNSVALQVGSGASVRLLTQSMNLGAGASLTVLSGGSFDFNNNSGVALNVTGSGAFALNSGGTLRITSPAGIAASGATGNVQATGSRSFSTGGTYQFVGNSSQSTGSGVPLSVANLGLDNANVLVLSQNISITGNANFISGLMNTGGFTINFADNATATGASNASYVAGLVTKTGDDGLFLFPIGKSGKYRPAGISNTGGAVTDAFSGEYFASGHPQSGTAALGSSGLNAVNNTEYWNLNRVAGISTPSVVLTWNAASNIGTAVLSDLRVAHYNSTTWDNYGNNGTTGDAMTGTITAGNVVNFSPFALATVAPSPLPLRLLSFTGRQNGGIISLQWTTTCEDAVKAFVVERAENSSAFTAISSVAAGNGGCAGTAQYAFSDPAVSAGSSYQYRLRMVENTGKETLSSTLRFSTVADGNVRILANPVAGNLELSGTTTGDVLRITDMTGRVLLQWLGDASGRYGIDGLAAGSYVLQVVHGNEATTLRFVKQ